MKVVYELTSEHIKQLHALYQGEWWTKGRILEDKIKAVKGSQICIGVIDENEKLVGFVRVITDFIYKALILDLIIKEESRKLGIGEKLINLIKNHKKLKEVNHFELYCLPELEEYYAKHGFSSEVGEIKFLRHEHA